MNRRVDSVLTFRMKNVQKFHPGISFWPSERLTSSSRCATAASKAEVIPSFSLVIVSAQTAGSFLSLVHVSCTHLCWSQCMLLNSSRHPDLSLLSTLKSAFTLSMRVPRIFSIPLDVVRASGRTTNKINHSWFRLCVTAVCQSFTCFLTVVL